jgi:transglutaminase-like putative cysteine protease
MRYEILHNTHYRYETPVSYSIILLRLTPRSDPGQKILEWHIDTPKRLQAQQDLFGNHTHLLTIAQPISSLDIQVRGLVEINEDASGHRFNPQNDLSPLIFTQSSHLTQADSALRAFAHEHVNLMQSCISERQTLNLMQAIHERIAYTTGSTNVFTTAEQAFAQSQGVCQDQAHVFLACARALGVPARYVSGYLNTGDTGHVASHAWVDVYTDAHEWLSIDITNACITDGRHCRLAIGRDYESAGPMRGNRTGGGTETMSTHVYVSAQGLIHQQ